MKVIIVVGDGMADRPVKELGGETPLQAARTPSMDRVARYGICGMMDVVSPGIPPGSDTAHLAIFGYDPYKTYEGRGVFEALGAGLEVGDGDVSFRCNFATVDEGMTVLDRRAGRIGDEAGELAKALDGFRPESHPDVRVVLKHTVEHRCAMILRGEGLSRMVSDSDPHEENRPVLEVKPLDQTPEAAKTSAVLNELTERSHMVLGVHPVNDMRRREGLPPANILLFRGAATRPKLRPIHDIYGVRSLAIAVGALYRGVARCVGMDVIDVEGATGTYGTDTLAKARAAVENLRDYDLIFVHVKAADNAGHDGDVEKKVMMIEKIDALIGYLLEHTDPKDAVITITADHTTPVGVREHTGDPVPVAIYGPGVRTDAVQRYSEVDCAMGGLGRIRGVDLMPILMNLVGKTKMFGA